LTLYVWYDLLKSFGPKTINHELISASVTLLALFGFGIAKRCFTGVSLFKSGFQTVFVGGMATGAAYLLAKAIS
jgi:vacuolar iron transporter family protein